MKTQHAPSNYKNPIVEDIFRSDWQLSKKWLKQYFADLSKLDIHIVDDIIAEKFWHEDQVTTPEERHFLSLSLRETHILLSLYVEKIEDLKDIIGNPVTNTIQWNKHITAQWIYRNIIKNKNILQSLISELLNQNIPTKYKDTAFLLNKDKTSAEIMSLFKWDDGTKKI